MNNEPSTAVVPLTVAQKLFGAYANWSSVPFIALPLGICIWSFSKSQSYYQDNETFHNTIQDIIDTTTFGKIIVPLFQYINTSLTRDLVSSNRIPEDINAQTVIEQADVIKVELIKNYDFSSLEQAIELQDSIEKIIKTKKDQTAFKRAVKKSRWFLIATTVVSAMNLVVGFILVGAQAVYGFENGSVKGLLVLWGILFTVVMAFIACFYYYKIKIEQMRYE